MTALHPELAARDSFEHLRLGRKPVERDRRTLALADYLDEAVVLPAIPETFALPDALASVSWPMYGNDRLGDCTCAAVGHMIQAWTADAGAERTPDGGDVEFAYWETGDPPAATGTPGGATDDGRSEIAVLNYWRNTGIGSAGEDKIGAYVSVDPKNHDHLRAGLYLFGGLYTGVALPKSAQSQPQWDVAGDGKTGDSQAGSWGGHAVPWLPVWDGATVELVTWGATMRATLAFSDLYTEEVYAVLSPDALVGSSGKTPAGFDVEALQADLAAIKADRP